MTDDGTDRSSCAHHRAVRPPTVPHHRGRHRLRHGHPPDRPPAGARGQFVAGRRAAGRGRRSLADQTRRRPDAGEPLVRPLLRRRCPVSGGSPTRRSRGGSSASPTPTTRTGTCSRSMPTPTARAPQALPSNRHGWSVQHQSWNRGRMDGFVTAHLAADGAAGQYTMAYFNRGRHPVPLGAGRRVHGLRRLPLLDARPDLAEPPVPDDRHRSTPEVRTAARSTATRCRRPGFSLDDLPGDADPGRRHLEASTRRPTTTA